VFRRAVILSLLVPAPLLAQAQTVNWPVYGGDANGTRYSTLRQITPANVAQLQVAWTYDTHDAFNGSEMQSNPIVVDGVLYATSPKQRLFALDAETGRELWSFDASRGRAGRFRYRGVVVYQDRVLFNYRSELWAIDRKTGQPILSFGDSGRVDLRLGLDRPVQGLSVSASTPGVIYRDLLILGTAVPEALPSAPGDVRAYDVHTGALRWTFHTIPHPGEPGHETWPSDAWKINGGANAWSGVTVDTAMAMVFAATGSAAFDFYGANRHGDNLYANSVIALDARSGKLVWHFQGVHHDLWDRDFPAPPALVSVMRNGRRVAAVAQITKSGHVFVFDRKTGTPLFPIENRAVPASTLDGERAAASQPFPVKPPPFARQALTEDMLTARTPQAHDSALAVFRRYTTTGIGMFTPPSLEGTIVFPGYDGGGEWGGPAFDPETGLLYVNSNEMAWLLKMIPRDDHSLYQANCAGCHGTDLKGTPGQVPSLVDIASRHTRAEVANIVQQGTGRMPGFSGIFDGSALNDLVDFLMTGHDQAERAATNPYWLKYRNDGYTIFLDPDGYPAIAPPWGTLNAIDLNQGTIRWTIPFGEYPDLAAKGLTNTGTDNYGGPVVTANGLLFIGATTYDKKFHVYDKLTGKLLWEATLPASGNATPSLYVVNGRQYVVIACGGGKNGAASGGTFVAFALPAR
jgi:quinoprotein glucose dehydrogenase